jgi:hypothetical protein
MGNGELRIQNECRAVGALREILGLLFCASHSLLHFLIAGCAVKVLSFRFPGFDFIDDPTAQQREPGRQRISAMLTVV